MEKFIKVLTPTGDKYYPVSELLVIEVDNNSPTDWYVRGLFAQSLGSFAVVGDINSETEARKIALELVSALGLIDGAVFQ
jgi:hypothetical protein